MTERAAAEKPGWGRRLVVMAVVCFLFFAAFLPLVLTSQPGPSLAVAKQKPQDGVDEVPQVRPVGLLRTDEKAAVKPAVFQIAPPAVCEVKAPPFEAVTVDRPAAECRCCAPAKTCRLAVCPVCRTASCRTKGRTRVRLIRCRGVRCR